MIAVYITSAGLLLINAELIWIRSYSPVETVEPTVGSLIGQFQQNADRWLYFLTSECSEWNPEIPGCLNSKIQLAMTTNVEYEIIAWSEAVDRRQPQREMLMVAEVWTFRPADVNMDSLVNCEDIDSFSQDTYDWNLDGEVTQADLNDLSWLVSVALSDVNGDGIVNLPDLLLLLGAWGPCPDPPEACPGDLDCDGKVGVPDLLRLLSVVGR